MRRTERQVGLRRLAIPLVTALALVAVGCGDEGSDPPPVDRDADQGIEPTRKDFFFDPGMYVGRVVTVTAYVSDVLTPVAFRIAGERFEGPGILVVSNTDLSSLDDDDLVQVTGPVRWFNVEGFARELGVTLDPVTFHEFEGGVAIAARLVTINGIRP